MKNKSILFIVIFTLLAGCSHKPLKASIAISLPEIKSGGWVGKFCEDKTSITYGGIAKPDQFKELTVGKCYHKYSVSKKDTMLMSFGDPFGNLDEKALLEEMDALIHPENYYSEEEINEIDCLPGSLCKESTDTYSKGGMIFFEVDSPVVKNPEIIKKISHIVKSKKLKIYVSGFTDSTATDKHNELLSKNRAESVAAEFMVNGVNKDQIILKWFAAKNPIADNSTEEGRSKNRRVQISPEELSQ